MPKTIDYPDPDKPKTTNPQPNTPEWEKHNWYQFFRERISRKDDNDLKAFISTAISQAVKKERERIADRFYKMLRVDLDLAGSISSGCTCIKCERYSKKMIKKLTHSSTDRYAVRLEYHSPLDIINSLTPSEKKI